MDHHTDSLDEWLKAHEFADATQLPDPAALQIPHGGAGLFDAVNFLSNDVFPDLAEFTSRPVDDHASTEKNKSNQGHEDTAPSHVIAFAKSSQGSVSSVQIEPVSTSGGPGTTTGISIYPDTHRELRNNSVENLPDTEGTSGSQGHLVEGSVGNRVGVGPIAAQPLWLPVSDDLATSQRLEVQPGSARQSQVDIASLQPPIAATVEQIPLLKKREQDSDTAKQVARGPAVPSKPSKRRKGGRPASNRAMTKQRTEGGPGNSSGNGRGIVKGSSSKRPAVARARAGTVTENLTAEERRKIRAERNRQSAEKSRLRYKQRALELEQNVLRLRTENRELKARVDTFRIQLQAALQNIENSGKGNFEGDGMVGSQVPALKAAIVAIEQVMRECPRTFGAEPGTAEKTTR